MTGYLHKFNLCWNDSTQFFRDQHSLIRLRMGYRNDFYFEYRINAVQKLVLFGTSSYSRLSKIL